MGSVEGGTSARGSLQGTSGASAVSKISVSSEQTETITQATSTPSRDYFNGTAQGSCIQCLRSCSCSSWMCQEGEGLELVSRDPTV
ncbi:hypothetical protein Anapl_14146 [Anas platyrhynchos]|uniref:Uncharacterized protein n=1 Tax=Anas platyrhynchos TaxID=8839 RepID=R0KCR1_ANAPL|nr:hypothetical protein Anapl_14146 [Anas platyrhynchos]